VTREFLSYGAKIIVVTHKLTPEQSRMYDGRKERIITISSDRRDWQIRKMVNNELDKKTLTEGLKSALIPEGRADNPSTEEIIPNYLRGFKGAPNQKENNAKNP